MTMPAPTTDLATGNIKGRIAKIVTERIARKLGTKFGSGDIADPIRSYVGNLPPAMVEAFGVGAAAFLQSPRGLAEWISSKTTFDVNKVDEALNEGVDSGVQSFLAAARGRHGGAVTDADYETAANEALQKLQAKNAFDDLNPLKKKVVVDGTNRIFHSLDCPVVWKSQTRSKGKEDRSETTRTSYKDGHKEQTLTWALDNEYEPTRGGCCGKSAKNAIDDALKSEKDFFACVDTLKDSTTTEEKRLYMGFYDMLGKASKKQLVELRDLGGDKRWTKAEVVQVLRVSNGDVETVIKLIGSKISRPKKQFMDQAADWAKKNWKAAMGIADPDNPEGQAEVDKIREGVDRFTAKIRRDAVRRRRRANELEAEFHRK